MDWTCSGFQSTTASDGDDRDSESVQRADVKREDDYVMKIAEFQEKIKSLRDELASERRLTDAE